MLSHSIPGIDLSHRASSLHQLCALFARSDPSTCPSPRYISLSQHQFAANVNTENPPSTLSLSKAGIEIAMSLFWLETGMDLRI